MFNILVNNIDISNLFAFIHNMSAVIYGITQFFYPSDYFLLLDSQKYNYTLSQGGAFLKFLEHITQIVSRKIVLIYTYPKSM